MAQQPKRDPSPADIALACAEIQRGWTAEEHMRRLRADLRPQYPLADHSVRTMTADDYERHLAAGPENFSSNDL